MTRSARLGAVAALALLTSTGAQAQFAGLLGKALGLRPAGVAGGYYQSHDQVRTFIQTDPYDETGYPKLIAKASEMAAARGFSRIGVTKAKCFMAIALGSPRAQTCYVIAIMLPAGGIAKPRGDRPVQYYDVAAVQAGVIAPSLP